METLTFDAQIAALAERGLTDRPGFLAALEAARPAEPVLKSILAWPREALPVVEAAVAPLTLDEGIALVLQQPEVIATNWGFSAAGSRRGDQRVPAFWISGKRPKLGWCCDRNPHTWLGTASCAGRVVPA